MTQHSLLQDRDYTVIIARSTWENHPAASEFTEAWAQAQTALLDLCQECAALDPDRLMLYSASGNHLLSQTNISAPIAERVKALLDSYNSDEPMDLVVTLEMVLENYFTRKSQGQTKENGEIIVVILDREPPNRVKLIKLLVKATEQMDRQEELGITFIQVGDDALTRGFLKSLDDDLATAGARFDIADTKLMTEMEQESLTEVLMGAIYG